MRSTYDFADNVTSNAVIVTTIEVSATILKYNAGENAAVEPGQTLSKIQRTMDPNNDDAIEESRTATQMFINTVIKES